MKKYDEEAFIYRIANMYYRDNISQQEIAASEGVSRSQIARLLNIARTSGMVKIYVEPPKKDNVTQLQKSVCALLGLEKAIVLPINAEAYDDYSLCMRDVAALAAPVVQKLIKKSKKIGVGIGASLYNLSMYIKNDLETSPNNVYSKTFITLCNSFGNTSVFFQPAIITNNFAVQYNASVFFVSSPSTIVDSQRWAETDRNIVEQSKVLWESLDTALIGIGPGKVKDHIYYNDLLKTPEIEFVYNEGVCGEICGNGFNAEGKLLNRTNGISPHAISFETLQKIPRTIAFAYGENKVKAIESAAKCGFFNILITDISTAKKLLGA